MSRKLTLDDIDDVRAYERHRAATRERLLEVKQRRRVALGTVVSVAFESRETMRYQVQEMARVEKLITDEEIQIELDIYNSMVPEPGMLCATLFIELISDEAMREWFPKLVGIERAIYIQLNDGQLVRSEPEAQHALQLTRAEMTSAVHYLTFTFNAQQVAAFGQGGSLGIDHPAYVEVTELLPSTIAELLGDLRAD